MSLPLCHRITNHVTGLAGEQQFADEMRALAARDHTAEEVTDLLCNHLPFEVAAELRGEYLALPKVLASLIVESWRMADEAARPWTFESIMPDSPLAFARGKKVRFVIDVDEDGVSLGVAHVAGHKADWYQPAARAIAAQA